MEQKQKAKKRLLIYILIAYGITYLMGILMWYGNTKGYDLTLFPTAQMLYPAAGVILGIFLVNKGDKNLPRGFFITVLVTTAILIVMAIVSVVAPLKEIKVQNMSFSIYNLASQYVLILCGIAAWILLAVAGKEKRAAAGLTRKNVKPAIIVVVVFVAIYLARTILSTAITGIQEGVGFRYTMEWFSIFKKPAVWTSLVSLPLSYLFAFIAFFGEEYGWRYYLQPLMQKKFGLRGGVVLLGVVWGLWHLPIDLFYYTQTSGIQMIFAQQITCIFLGIFFAYAYMKTENIWVPVCLHFLNNNLVPIITATFTADVLENQVVHWSDLPLSLVIDGVCFGFFLLSGVFKKKGSGHVKLAE